MRKIYYTLSPSLRLWARRIYYFPIDLFEMVCRKRDQMIPPRGKIFVGSGDFLAQGTRLMDLVIEHTKLKPEGKILDIGCGIGRLAVPLTQYLDVEGRYDGFDIVKEGIEWCNKKISPLFPHFHFLYVDLKNDLYNLKTNKEARNFVFPYTENYYDSIVLTSVFTHMLPDDIDNYLKQIAFVMNKKGRCLATFFLLNPAVKKQMENNQIKFKFVHSYNGYSLMNKNVKEANVAYDETFLFSLLEKNGLQPVSVFRGSWSNGLSPLDFQDVVIIEKKV